MRFENHIHIGTSGWNFKSWKGRFYPSNIKETGFLKSYANTLNTVELNNSFYKLPQRKNIQKWCEDTPNEFIFSCKASRYITHMKKLKDPQKSLQKLFAAFEPFGKKLGPILFQLPPYWSVNIPRLEAFFEALPQNKRYAFEFRDKSWLCDDIYEILQKNKAALCFYDYSGYQSPEVLTTDFIYMRLHGPKETAYEGSYTDKVLQNYARKIVDWAKRGKEIYCYFDNDQKSYAPFNAQTLKKNIERFL